MKLGILSDTHGYVDDVIIKHLATCDEIWHAGDIGNLDVTDELNKTAPVEAVWGNIDNAKARIHFPEYLVKEINGMKLLMIHIAGSFSRYNTQTQKLIREHQPDMLICGHSHILKIAFDQKFKLLYLNPGAAGRSGFHKVRTLVRLEIEDSKPKNCEVVELGPRSAKAVN